MKDGNIIKEIFENPALIENLSMDKIDRWIDETPYVQYLHLLKALKLKSQGVTDPSAYHKAATVVTDRIKMNELLDKVESPEAEKKKEKRPKQKEKKKPKKTRNKKNNDQAKDHKKHIKSEKKTEVEKKATPEKDKVKIEEEIIIDWDTYVSSQSREDRVEQLEIQDYKEEEESRSLYQGHSELSEFSEWLLAFSGKNEEISEDQIDQSVSIDGAAISETLAKLMEQQGHVLKAIEMYEKLSLINPEKSAYFAALIKKLKQQ